MKKLKFTALAVSSLAFFACEQATTESLDRDEDDSEVSFNCHTESLKDSTGIKIICNGDSIGYVLNGVDGKDKPSSDISINAVEATEDHPNGGVQIITVNTDFEGNVKADTLYIWNGADRADGYSPTVETVNMDPTEEHPNGGIQIIVTYKDAEGNIANDTTYVWNGANGENGEDGKDFIPSSSSEETPSSRSEEEISSSSVEDVESSDSAEESSSSSSIEGIESSSSVETISSSSEESSSSMEQVSSSSSEPEISSSSEDISSSSEPESSSSSEDISSSSIAELSQACKDLRATDDHFIAIEDVFGCVQPNEKVAFIIRHGERGSNTHRDGDLNDNGVDQAQFVGRKIGALNLEDFYYVSTDIYRTMNTSIQISQGKGETFLSKDAIFEEYDVTKLNEIHFEKNGDFGDAWYKTPSYSDNCAGVDGWGQYTLMAYDTAACKNDFYNVDEKVSEITSKHFRYENMKRYTIVASHDQFIAPFLISVTNRKIKMEYHWYGWGNDGFKHWPNYLSGVAIIVNDQNEVDYVPVRGLNTGYLGEHCVNGYEDGYKCKRYE